jgi:hypothetical protein
MKIQTNSVFFDYDNDSNLDLLVVGKGGDWRFPMSKKYTLLYRYSGKESNYKLEQVYNTGFKQECDEMYFNTTVLVDTIAEVLNVKSDTDRAGFGRG